MKDIYLETFFLNTCFLNLWLPGDTGGEEINGEVGTDMYILLYVKRVSNKNLLYSTGNSALYSNGLYGERIKKKKEWVYENLLTCNSHSIVNIPPPKKPKTPVFAFREFRLSYKWNTQ